MASLIGLPVGIAAGIYCAEYPDQPAHLAHAVRGGRAQRHAVDRGRRLRLGLDRGHAEALLRPRRQRGAGHADDPDGAPHHRGDDQAGAQLAPRGGARARLPALAHQPRDRGADHAAGHRDRRLLAVARIAGETAPLLFTALGSQYLSYNLNQPMAALPLTVFTYATGPVRGVAPVRLGRGAGPHPGRVRAQPRRAAGHPPEVRPQWLSLPLSEPTAATPGARARPRLRAGAPAPIGSRPTSSPRCTASSPR